MQNQLDGIIRNKAIYQKVATAMAGVATVAHGSNVAHE